MSKERELLKKVIYGDDKGDFFISYDLYKEIYELLAQPEQDKAGAVMPNGVCVSNVYDAYEEGRKSVMVEQEPEAWMYKWIPPSTGLLTRSATDYIHMGKDKPFVNDDIKVSDFTPLYLAPPTRKPLSEEAVGKLLMGGFSTHLMDLVRMVEQAHGIGGGNE